jgi:hypothetical protein
MYLPYSAATVPLILADQSQLTVRSFWQSEAKKLNDY